MASTSTGEMFTQEQYNEMSEQQRTDLDIVRVNPQESNLLQSMSLEDRKTWLKEHKSNKPSRRQLNKRQRQNRKVARNAAR